MASTLAEIIKRIGANTHQEVSFLSAVTTGIFAGFMMVIMTITYASLIFSGELSHFVGQGIAVGLTSVVVIGTILTLFSRSSHLVVQIDDDTAPVFALLLAILAASMPTDISSTTLLTNLLVALFLTTLISGITLYLFGLFNFGSFVQFIPYSVMGGYFAAVGWLLLTGAITMLTGATLSSLTAVAHLFSAANLTTWVPAVIIGLWLHIMSHKFNNGALLGGTIIASVSAYFIAAAYQGYSPSQLLESGSLIGPFMDQNRHILEPIFFLDWSSLQIQSSLGTTGGIASITLISLLSIILCVSGLSLTTRRDLDINHELKVTGLANISSAFMGGMSALPSLSISKLAYDIHPRASRLIGITATLIGALVFFFGMSLLAYTPKFILGALSIYIGLGFVRDWLIDGIKKFGIVEYSVIPCILVVTIFAGFLQGVVTGIVAAIILFVIKYSRTQVIRYQATGTELRSNITRDAKQNQLLQQHGELIRIFNLQGYLFFGTAGSLYKNVLAAIDNSESNSVRYVILDFTHVIGVDSSATLNFEKLAQRLVERNIFMVTTNLNSKMLELLRRGGLELETNAFLVQHGEIDQGLEWCENAILTELNAKSGEHQGILESIEASLTNPELINKLKQYLHKEPVEAGQLLMNINDESDKVYFLESCSASAYIKDSNDAERRVAGAGRGSVFGEIGFILGVPRTALVRTDSNGDIFSLSRTNLTKMEAQDPELAAAIMRYLAHIVTERLASTTNSLRAVL